MGYKKGSIIIMCFLMIFSVVGCESENGDKSKDGAEANATSEFGYDTKMALREMEDGWVHYFICEFDKNSGNPLMFYYDAYNLKYKQLDDYTIEVTDSEGNICQKNEYSLQSIA